MSWARASICRHGLTVPQYACLELLDQHSGLSNAELARGAFVTRQSMQRDLRGRISSNPPADGHRTCQVRAQTCKRQDSQHKFASQSHEATITT
jgi:hypothetical protein